VLPDENRCLNQTATPEITNMKKTHLLLVSIVLAAVVTVVWTRTHAQQPRVVAPVARVAVCDVGEIFNGYQRRGDLNTLFENKRKAANTEDEKKIARIKQLQGVLENLAANTKEYTQKLEELEKATIERQIWRQFTEQKFTREHRLLMQELYSEVLAAIGDTARAKGYDLVMYKDQIEVQSKTTSELLGKIAQRKCLYVNPAIDITKPVLQLLNQRYAARKR